MIDFVNYYFSLSPFWLGGHGSFLVVPANVVFHWMSLEISLLHLFCSVFDKKLNLRIDSESLKIFWMIRSVSFLRI